MRVDQHGKPATLIHVPHAFELLLPPVLAWGDDLDGEVGRDHRLLAGVLGRVTADVDRDVREQSPVGNIGAQLDVEQTAVEDALYSLMKSI